MKIGLYTVLFGGCAMLLILLPRSASLWLFGLLTLGCWIWVMRQQRFAPAQFLKGAGRGLQFLILKPSFSTQTTVPAVPGSRVLVSSYAPVRLLIRCVHKLIALVEITAITLVALLTTRSLHVGDKQFWLGGVEAEYLTSSAYQASWSLREYGYIPQWQPWLEHGEPLLTDPFAFVFNPLSTVPSLLVGGQQGIKISIVLYAVFAGWGGWFLGRALGLGSLGRVLLGLLLVGKGNVYAAFSVGFFQLGVSQAYMPWITAGIIGIFRYPDRRWPPVLCAVMLTLLFWAGNLWYTVPMAITVVVLGALLLIHRPGKGMEPLDLHALKRLIWACALTLGLAAITLLPMWAQRDRIQHPIIAGDEPHLSLPEAVERYLQDDPTASFLGENGIYPPTYYNFTAPWWYIALVFALFPRTYRSKHTWVAGGLLLALFTAWGAGGNPVIVWLYDQFDLLRHWRYSGRALAAGAFWLAVLIAMRADSVIHALNALPQQHPRIRLAVVRMAQAALVLATLGATDELFSARSQFVIEHREYPNRATCIDWLRASHPYEELTVFAYAGFGYSAVFLKNHVRLYNIELPFNTAPLPSTIGELDLLRALPEYGIAHNEAERKFLIDAGYTPVADSPFAYEQSPCLYVKPDAFSYAFTVPLVVIAHARPTDTLEAFLTTPADVEQRTPDRVTLRVAANATQPQVVVIEELAYPGWRVWIDGHVARIESVGGWNGVILPPGTGAHTLRFAFRPALFYQAAGITLGTILVCVVFLLRLPILPG